MVVMATKSKVIIESDVEFSNSSDESDTNCNSVAVTSTNASTTSNAGWADSVAKILKTQKPKGKKTLVLSKAKKLTDVRKTITKDAGFDVQHEDGEIRKAETNIPNAFIDNHDAEQPLRKKKKELPSVRIKPNILEKDRERVLSKIATKGVVQLFNAVKKQQKDIDCKLQDAGPLEVKRDKVLRNIDKREFLKVLMGNKSEDNIKPPQTNKITKPNKNIDKNESTWSVLHDDFMMGTKMKDWDKEMEEDVEQEIIEESE